MSDVRCLSEFYHITAGTNGDSSGDWLLSVRLDRLGHTQVHTPSTPIEILLRSKRLAFLFLVLTGKETRPSLKLAFCCMVSGCVSLTILQLSYFFLLWSFPGFPNLRSKEKFLKETGLVLSTWSF